MKRAQLVKLIGTRSEENDITFQHGFIYRMNEGIKGYPLFWLCPFTLTNRYVNGKEIETTYSGEAYIHHLNDKFDEDRKDIIWEEQEDKAITILTSLPDNSDIISVTEIQCDPDEFKFKDGTISTKITFNIKVYHCEA